MLKRRDFVPTYAILQNPGHNRVYFQAARKLAQIELQYASRCLSAPIENVREESLGGVIYLLFDMQSPLTDGDCIVLSRLSFTYAIFSITDSVSTSSSTSISISNGNPLLTPLMKNPAYFFESDDISTILKYTGKTNELFTRMMLNIACFTYSTNKLPLQGELSIFDPLCGKGTTLFEGLLCGHNVYGIEIDSKTVHEAYTFLKKYLETARYKHNTHQERIGTAAGTAQRYQLTLSRSKNDIINEKDKKDKKATTLQAEFISGDTRQIGSFYKKNSFHAIVGDLPYGVQHGSKSHKNEMRNALPLLSEALPGWHRALKQGSVIVLAWNLFLISREEMEYTLIRHGFELPDFFVNFVNSVNFVKKHDFSHRVDQAIERDIIVGRKK